MSFFNQYIERYRREEEDYSLEEFLAICKNDSMAYASSAERMLAAIGEPELVDTRQDPRALYAVLDEWHQSFVPNRQGAVADVFIDLSGAAIAIAIVWILHRRRWHHTKAIANRLPAEPAQMG